MKMFDQEKFNQFLIKHEIIKLFSEPITLVSGRKTYMYANCRNLLNTVGDIDRLSDYILDFIEEKGLKYDYFFGVPEGATKLTDILNYKYGKQNHNPDQRLVMGRGKAKEHGIVVDKYFIGNVKQGDRVILIEDVTTTGGSLIKSAHLLRESGVDIIAAVVIVNRMQKTEENLSVEEKLSQEGIRCLYLSDATAILRVLVKDGIKDPQIVNNLQKEFKQYGVKELTW
ncbi:hypothetical protein HYY69_08095 [Candidatus Woesearchaeota archaeon]|nr:hypothetical protein [Candidatus Woesearchaeota archaeon]